MNTNYELCKTIRDGIVKSGKAIQTISDETGIPNYRIVLIMQKVIELTYDELISFRLYLDVDLGFLDFMDEYDKKNNKFTDAIKRYREYTARYTVYAIRCSKNGKMWVGVTSSLYTRIRSHMSELRSGRHSCKEMLDDYRKFGENEFRVFKLAEGIMHEDRLTEESKYMDMYRTRESEFGYNTRHRKPKECINKFMADGMPPLPIEKM